MLCSIGANATPLRLIIDANVTVARFLRNGVQPLRTDEIIDAHTTTAQRFGVGGRPLPPAAQVADMRCCMDAGGRSPRARRVGRRPPSPPAKEVIAVLNWL